jgi:hypothetical protein
MWISCSMFARKNYFNADMHAVEMVEKADEGKRDILTSLFRNI